VQTAAAQDKQTKENSSQVIFNKRVVIYMYFTVAPSQTVLDDRWGELFYRSTTIHRFRARVSLGGIVAISMGVFSVPPLHQTIASPLYQTIGSSSLPNNGFPSLHQTFLSPMFTQQQSAKHSQQSAQHSHPSSQTKQQQSAARQASKHPRSFCCRGCGGGGP